MIYFKKSREKRVSPFQLFAAASPLLETPQIRVGNPVKIKTWGFFFPAYFSPSFISPPASALTDPIPGKTPVPKRCGASPGLLSPSQPPARARAKNPPLFPLLSTRFLLFLSLDSVPRMPPLPVHPGPRRRWLFPSVPAGLDSHRTFPGG